MSNIKLLTRSINKNSPFDLKEYESLGGFTGLKKAVNMERSQVIEEVLAAQLRGRGGAGYAAGKKWKSLFKIDEDPKYIVCNADEGEPGTFKDRQFLEKDPLIVIEGMIIAGYVFQAKAGYIYIRGEYRDIMDNFNRALDNARNAGYLGNNILGIEGFNYDINVISGAGAYVCGENSTLLNSIEGKAGRPRIKPPHLAEVGLFGKPTLVNNVESFAAISVILDIGGEKFRSYGTEQDGGTCMVSLSGHAKNKGVYEVPIGTSLYDIVYNEEFGGGTATGRPLQFIHMGGQSGPIAFPEQLNVNYDIESLSKVDLARGTGALVLADDSVSLIEYLKKVMEFFIEESCGKCNPCREGNQQMYIILDRLSKGEGREGDLELMADLSDAMMRASFCGLGQASTTVVESVLKYRRNILEACISKKEELV